VGHQTNITKQTFNLNAKVSHRVFSPVFAFKVMHGVPLLTRFRKLLTIASEMGGGGDARASSASMARHLWTTSNYWRGTFKISWIIFWKEIFQEVFLKQ